METYSEWCQSCMRMIEEGTEHDYWSHGSTRESAEELLNWKNSFEQEG